LGNIWEIFSQTHPVTLFSNVTKMAGAMKIDTCTYTAQLHELNFFQERIFQERIFQERIFQERIFQEWILELPRTDLPRTDLGSSKNGSWILQDPRTLFSATAVIGVRQVAIF
jgi:hypothetical protein